MNQTDILGALCFDAMRIVASVNQAAAGSPFPDPRALRVLAEGMFQKAQTYEKMAAQSIAANAAMNVELAN